ncbi:MAG: dipeptidase [Candidatus Ornithomonoglobus sp.]
MYKYEIFDAHCDTLCMIANSGGNIIKNKYNIDKTRMLRYNKYTQVFACFIAPEHRNMAMERFNRLADIFDAQDFDGITPLLSVEGGEMIQSLEDVDYLKSRGVRCIALTWNHANRIAGGADEPEQGLTEFGRAVVRRMNELGILVDVSHLNDKSFYDIEKINTGILIATHSNSRAVCGHRRNLTDDMFKIIRDSGGAAGINLYPPFVTESGVCEVSDVLRHIERWMELGGENAVGLGGDFDGVENNLPQGISGCEDYYKLLDMLDEETAEKISHKNFERIFFR